MNATPLILECAREANVLQAALMYAHANISVLACRRDKTPALSNWKHLQQRLADPVTIARWHQAGLLESVGLICGRVSGNLVVVDCDGQAAVDTFCKAFPHLLDTYTVLSGSGKGAHFYYYAKLNPPTTRVVGAPFGNIELRSDGAYVIAPPSLHPSGNAYQVINPVSILHVFDLHEVVQWIKGQIAEKHGGTLPPATGTIIHGTAYGRAALAGECAYVRMAPVGGRNLSLFRAALKVGSLVRDGKIDRAEAERELFAAAEALTAEEGEIATQRAIRNGINTGMESSREQHKYA